MSNIEVLYVESGEIVKGEKVGDHLVIVKRPLKYEPKESNFYELHPIATKVEGRPVVGMGTQIVNGIQRKGLAKLVASKIDSMGIGPTLVLVAKGEVTQQQWKDSGQAVMAAAASAFAEWEMTNGKRKK